MRIRRILHVPTRTQLIPYRRRHRRRTILTPRKKVSNVHRRPLQRVLQPKRVEHEHGIVVIKFRDELLVVCDRRDFPCTW
jgi:hypothetical protein